MARQSEQFQSRWGDSELDDTGYLHIPGWIMRNYHNVTDKEGQVVGLTPNEFTFLSHVMCFKYDVSDSEARPSLETIAQRIGRHVSNIRKWKASLEDKGLLEVTHHDGKPSTYDFGPLVSQCRALESKTATPSEITTPSKIAKTTPSEITSTPLAKSLTEESEVKSEPKSKNVSPAAPEPPKIVPIDPDTASYDEWLVTIAKVFQVGTSSAQARNYYNMFKGRAKTGKWQEHNISPPATLDEFKAWVIYEKRQHVEKFGESEFNLRKTDTINGKFLYWRERKEAQQAERERRQELESA